MSDVFIKSAILNELYSQLQHKHIQVEKKSEKVNDAQGDINLYLTIANLTLQAISTLIDTLTFFGNKNKNKKEYQEIKYYVNITLKNGQIINQKNLPYDKMQKIVHKAKENFNEIAIIEIG